MSRGFFRGAFFGDDMVPITRMEPCGAVFNLHSNRRLQSFRLNLEELESTAGKSNRVVFVNTPSNALSFVVGIEVKVIFFFKTSGWRWRQSLIDFQGKSTWF